MCLNVFFFFLIKNVKINPYNFNSILTACVTKDILFYPLDFERRYTEIKLWVPIMGKTIINS